jgi:hypothetical protein
MLSFLIEAQCPAPPSSSVGADDPRAKVRLQRLQEDWRQQKCNKLISILRGKAFGTLTGWDPETGKFRFTVNSLERGTTPEDVQAIVREAGFTLLGTNGSEASALSVTSAL